MWWWAAEPDYPPSTLFRSGSPARLLAARDWRVRAGAGRAAGVWTKFGEKDEWLEKLGGDRRWVTGCVRGRRR